MEGGQHQAMLQYTVTLEKVGVNDDMGFVIGMMTGSTATLTLLAARTLEYGAITGEVIAQVAADIRHLTCVTCPNIEVVIVAKNDCLSGGLNKDLKLGMKGSIKFCEKYKKGISCAAGVLLSNLSGDINYLNNSAANSRITPINCGG